jgi:hypothetical protein
VKGKPLPCDDGLFCTGQETCNPSYGCLEGTPVVCGVISRPCEESVCSESDKGCVIAPKGDGESCDDTLGCTMFDACVGGTCSGVDVCEDGQSCSLQTGVCEVSADSDLDGMFDASDPCPEDARNACYGEAAVDTTSGWPIRVNAGDPATCGGRRTDCNGDVWYEDFGYKKRFGSTPCNLPGGCALQGLEELFGCEDASTEEMFQCDNSSPNKRIVYDFAVPNGVYLVNLYFANTESQTQAEGARVFDIMFEGEVKVPGFDQVAAAGGSGIVVARSTIVEVLDGSLTIALHPRAGAAAVKAIEVLTPSAVP